MIKDRYSPEEIQLEHICRQCFEDHWKWEDCPNKANWHPPSAIFYCSHQMMWGILHLGMLEEGDWPPEHKDTGYIGSKGSRNTRTKFLPAALFFAEITYRFKATGEAGEALVDEVQGGVTEYKGLSRPAKRALNYISGWRRRKLSYSEWKKDQKWRAKHNRSVVNKI